MKEDLTAVLATLTQLVATQQKQLELMQAREDERTNSSINGPVQKIEAKWRANEEALKLVRGWVCHGSYHAHDDQAGVAWSEPVRIEVNQRHPGEEPWLVNITPLAGFADFREKVALPETAKAFGPQLESARKAGRVADLAKLEQVREVGSGTWLGIRQITYRRARLPMIRRTIGPSQSLAKLIEAGVLSDVTRDGEAAEAE
jgi:hypothetical protein